jgi:TolA-binding protein
MQAEQVQDAFLLKFWPWFEANLKKIIVGAAVLAVVATVVGFYVWQRNRNQTIAAEALTHALVSSPNNLTDAYLQVAAEYPGTSAGARALLQAATMLFTQSQYANAQAQFQRFLNAYPDNIFVAQASLGLAACLDSQGKTSDAINAYRKVIEETTDENVLAQAKFSLARIYDSQGRFADARDFYEGVVRANPYSSLGQQAAIRLQELNLPDESATTNPAKPSSLLLATTNLPALKSSSH